MEVSPSEEVSPRKDSPPAPQMAPVTPIIVKPESASESTPSPSATPSSPSPPSRFRK